MTLADIFRRFANEYLNKYKKNILPSHVKVIDAIINCRTDIMGGQIWFCQSCEKYHYSYHSCKDRHCPQCGNNASDLWLEKQNKLLLPAIYFMATFTVPEPLRYFIRSHQKLMYNILFQTSAKALQTLAQDKRFIGGTIGMTGVLHTWTRDLNYHPHIHYLIPGGGLRADLRKWRRCKSDFLMHVKPLSIIYRDLFKTAVRKAGLYNQIPTSVWKQEWVVNIIPVGNGESTLKYLAPYICRVAISNRNIISIDDKNVTFRYKKSGEGHFTYLKLNAMEFMRRFLQHVLPKGFIKVRYYGLFSPRKKGLLTIAKKLLGVLLSKISGKEKLSRQMLCPECNGLMIFLNEIKHYRGPPILQKVI